MNNWKNNGRKVTRMILLELAFVLCFLVTGCAEKTAETSKTIQKETTASSTTVATTETTMQETTAAQTTTKLETTEAAENQFAPGKVYDFTICFAGDINLDENWATTQYLNTCQNGIWDCISGDLMEKMRSADIMCLNNEFTYSEQGTPMSGKAYTFRAHPSRVSVLQEMGVDIVKLANNHVYDYGKAALLDTFTTLENAGIKYMGAGRNLSEAMKPVYVELDGVRVAFVAASRAEKNKMTPQATDREPGILRCYDTTLFKQVIGEADKYADIVIAYVHWGTEYSFTLESAQKTTGREYLDAGADVIVGAHTHCIQGMEYYKGKPIIYSLGNFWFNEKYLDSMLLELHFSSDGVSENLHVQITPAKQAGCQTRTITDAAEKTNIFSFLEGCSINTTIDKSGRVLPKQ